MRREARERERERNPPPPAPPGCRRIWSIPPTPRVTPDFAGRAHRRAAAPLTPEPRRARPPNWPAPDPACRAPVPARRVTLPAHRAPLAAAAQENLKSPRRFVDF